MSVIIIIITQIKNLYKQFGDGSSSLPPHLQKFRGVPTQWIPPQTNQPEHEAYHSFPSRANIAIA
jgi:predicted DNA-binding ArsR family transcriptional regulator